MPSVTPTPALPPPPLRPRRPHPALAWARSGAMALTGERDGAPVAMPAPVAVAAQRALDALAAAAGARWRGPRDGAALLGERAAIAGLRRNGTRSVGGGSRLLPARDGWLAVTLAREDDLTLLPAWLASPEPLAEAGRDAAWRFVTAAAAERSASALVERGRLLGLPVAPVPDPPAVAPPFPRIAARGPRRAPRRGERPLVVDLSALWAGPLCTHLLACAGARVVKVESRARPDGARAGPAHFFDLLNAGKESVALDDLAAAADRRRLRALLLAADVVVESARPRALAQLGIDAAELVTGRPGLTWVSITAYGRGEPECRWVGFGDDAAAAAGLAAVAGGGRATPLFCADAVADPLAGIHAAAAALASWRRGGGTLLDVALRDAAAHALCADATRWPAAHVERMRRGVVDADWEVAVEGERAPVLPPRAREPDGVARPLGTDTDTVLRALAC